MAPKIYLGEQAHPALGTWVQPAQPLPSRAVGSACAPFRLEGVFAHDGRKNIHDGGHVMLDDTGSGLTELGVGDDRRTTDSALGGPHYTASATLLCE